MKYLFLQYLSICQQWYVCICFGYLCISRSNFVNASQEKFSPVSKVLHRIQNKFPGSQSATLSQLFSIFLTLWYITNKCWRNLVVFCVRVFCVWLVLVSTAARSVLPPFLKWFSFDLRPRAPSPPPSQLPSNAEKVKIFSTKTATQLVARKTLVYILCVFTLQWFSFDLRWLLPEFPLIP